MPRPIGGNANGLEARMTALERHARKMTKGLRQEEGVLCTTLIIQCEKAGALKQLGDKVNIAMQRHQDAAVAGPSDPYGPPHVAVVMALLMS